MCSWNLYFHNQCSFHLKTSLTKVLKFINYTQTRTPLYILTYLVCTLISCHMIILCCICASIKLDLELTSLGVAIITNNVLIFWHRTLQSCFVTATKSRFRGLHINSKLQNFYLWGFKVFLNFMNACIEFEPWTHPFILRKHSMLLCRKCLSLLRSYHRW